MNKLIRLLILICFIYFNPTQVKFSHAISLFKSPLEICMDRVIDNEGEYETAYAARVCNGN